MFLKSLGLFAALCFLSLTAQADPVAIPVPVPVPATDQDHGQDAPQEFCKEYNRDGITCDQVGFHEGQLGYPWGRQSGPFRCVNGCLAWVGQAQHCKAYNRDGVTCAQVGFYDGQVGYPWGHKSGKFRCMSGCLQFLGWW